MLKLELKPELAKSAAESEKRTAVAELRIAEKFLAYGYSSEFVAYQEKIKADLKDSNEKSKQAGVAGDSAQEKVRKDSKEKSKQTRAAGDSASEKVMNWFED